MPSVDGSLKRMRLRRTGTCRRRGVALPEGTPAVYDRAARDVECLACADGPAAAPSPQAPAPTTTEAGTAGASARREHERRSAKREARIRADHPRLGGVILALTDDPQSTTAWAVGARGEEPARGATRCPRCRRRPAAARPPHPAHARQHRPRRDQRRRRGRHRRQALPGPPAARGRRRTVPTAHRAAEGRRARLHQAGGWCAAAGRTGARRARRARCG
nr:hypothetical protein [Angustibacter aerolatus]